MAILCSKQEKNLSWAAATFFAPIITPYFIIKSGQKQPAKWIILFAVTFLLMVAAEGFLWNKAYKKTQFAHLNPVERTALRLTQAIQKNIEKSKEVMQSIDIKNTVASGKKEIIITKELISQANDLIRREEMLTKKFALLVTNYGSYFQKTHQNWAIELRNFYKSKTMTKHYEMTNNYLSNFEKLLNYTQSNFDAIRSKRSKEMKSYDQYFIRYRRGLDYYQSYSDQRMKIQKKLVAKYPNLAPYLPGRAQTKAVNLWE